MRLTKVKLCNFRCFGSNEQSIETDHLTAFIGGNSSGKTAVLAALSCMFSENSSDRLLQRSDFHLPKDQDPDDMERQSLYIETVFTFDELNDDAADGAEYSVPQFFQHLVVEEPGGTPYLRVRLDATWEKGSTVEGSIESQIRYITCPESVQISDSDYVSARRRDLDSIRVIYIPAMRDPSRQLRNTSGTMMYQVMSSINWSNATKDDIRSKIQDLNAAFEKESGVSMFGSSISKQWKIYDSDERYSNATLRFNSTDIESSIKKAEIVFMPTVTGKEYSIDQMSDGLRSLFYISMVDSILDVEHQMQQQIKTDPLHTSFNRIPPILTIVAIEEPENHIAPHLLGRLVFNLKSIASKKNAQAIMTSHSPAIVKRIDPVAIRHFRLIHDGTTQVRRIILPDKEKEEEQYKFVKEAVKAYPEIYFAKLVILGEGDSEELLLPRFWEATNGDVDLSGVSIVPLGGRHVNHFWRLLNDLDIPYVTLLDLDREREGGGWGRIHYVLSQLMKLGIKRKDLLSTTNGTLSKADFQQMIQWNVADLQSMQSWIDFLENYNVFFSSPLDIDFLMLENYADIYKDLLSEREGPRLTVAAGGETTTYTVRALEKADVSAAEYISRMERDVKATLKENGGDGSTYSEGQKKLMVWYNYFFLNRGKPSTHMSALSAMSSEILMANIPPVFERLIKAAERQQAGEVNEDH